MKLDTFSKALAAVFPLAMVTHPQASPADKIGACSVEAVAKASADYKCEAQTRSGPVAWQVVAVLQGERTFRVWKDLKSGLYVSDDLGKHSPTAAIKDHLCTSPEYASHRGNLGGVGWRLPTGYPRKLNGKKNFPQQDSDFVTLEADGIRQVVPGLMNKWFVSSSEAEGDGFFYGFDGEFGGIDYTCYGNGNVSVRCVGQ